MAVARACALAVTAGALSLVAVPSPAQPAAAVPGSPTATPKPRPSIRLPAAERQAIEAAQASRGSPARVEDELAPTAADMKPRAEDERNTTRIEQHRVSNRISEVVVTPAGQSRSYVMTNREGQQPFGTTQMNSGGLSVPMFFRIEFGRTTLPPTTNPPLPPASSPSR